MEISGSLDKAKRDALPEGDFAVPGKRKLPIHDAKHLRLAHDMIDRTGGLTPEEKSEARRKIAEKAKSLGVDISEWHKIKAVRFDAMALNISNDDSHPNKMPFSGILVRLDEPSDEPPGGSAGRRIIVTSAAAEKALATLLGMAVDFMPDFEGHDPQAKIGIITEANIVDSAIEIAGFIYAADFPMEAVRIRAGKSTLGFTVDSVAVIQRPKTPRVRAPTTAGSLEAVLG